MSGNKAKARSDIDHETSGRISMPMTLAATELDPEFYFDDSLVVIQVESTLFRVHKYQLIKSETFSDMFKMPKGTTRELEEGSSRESPIVLNGVKASEFRALLKVLYAVYFTNDEPKCEPEIIVPAFRLAHMWNFSDLRTHLLPFVTDALGCADKIVVARELGIQEWLAPAHVELCQRPEPLTMEEGTKLGMHSTIMINQLREQFRPSQAVSNSGVTGDYCPSCLSKSYYGSQGHTSCRQCRADRGGGYGGYYRFPAAPSGTAQTISNDGLEARVKKWVEGGCVTE